MKKEHTIRRDSADKESAIPSSAISRGRAPSSSISEPINHGDPPTMHYPRNRLDAILQQPLPYTITCPSAAIALSLRRALYNRRATLALRGELPHDCEMQVSGSTITLRPVRELTIVTATSTGEIVNGN